MSEFLAVVVVALTAQLAVLPGEKVQFLISGLSTHYRPTVVVAAAGTAFAGWTALEIAFGNAIKGLLSPVVLDGISAAMFLFFGYLLVRSVPDQEITASRTDGGVAAVEEMELPVVGEVPDYLGGFVPIFAMMTVGEFGDKTQLVTISLALQYGAHPGIWVGEMLAIIPVSIANAMFFHRFATEFDRKKAHLFGAGLFVFFGLDTFLSIATGFSVWETIVSTIAGLVL